MRISDLVEQSVENLGRPSPWAAFLDSVPLLSESLTALDKHVYVYRGIKSQTRLLFQPQMTPGYRKSADGDNFYTLILDNLPAWQKYPPRSASVICTLNKEHTKHFGQTYLVLPQGAPSVGICSKSDIWWGFDHMVKTLDNYAGGVKTLSEFNHAINQVIQEATGKWDLESIDYPELVNLMNKSLKWFKRQPGYVKAEELDSSTTALWRFLQKGDLQQQLSTLLDPTKNSFELANWERLESFKNKNMEVWFSAPTWFLHLDSLPKKLLTNLTSKGLISYAKSQAGPK
jgi:hypothetical protein